MSKEFSGWAELHILVGFEIFILYAEHVIKWQLLERHRDDSTCDSFVWEYNEKYDMQKLTNYVKSNLRSEMSQSKRFQHSGPKVSLCNRAQPFAGSHCCALLLCILLLGNGAGSAIGQCLIVPTHKQPTITELLQVLVLLSSWSGLQWALPTDN